MTNETKYCKIKKVTVLQYLPHTGEWKKDQPEGQGTMTYTNGSVFEGEWNKAELIHANTRQRIALFANQLI